VTDKKSTGKRRVTMEVDMAWLEELPEEQKHPPRKRSKRPPPLPRPSKPPRRDTIEVKSEWLIPPLPEGHAAGGKPAAPATHGTVAKPRGKLPPPLPREEPESSGDHKKHKSKKPPRPSKRPPRAKP
jgi:hypothetical protein